MNRFVLGTLSFLALAASSALADSVTLYPTGVPNTIGNTTTSAPGFAGESWQANATTAGAKSEVYIPIGLLFSHAVSISDIKSISYWTNKPGASGDVDWGLYIYTNSSPGGIPAGDSATWYRSRLTAEPYFSNTPTGSDPANTWHQWATNGSNPLLFYDSNRNGGLLGTYTDPTLATLQSGPVSWPAAQTHDYTGETIKYISFQTGSGWANGFTGLLDGLTVTLNDDEVGTANFEATPLPSVGSTGMVMLAALGLGSYLYSRKARQLA